VGGGGGFGLVLGASGAGVGLAHFTLHAGAYSADARAFHAALEFAEEEVRLTRPIPSS
jgi:hypothetical protein